VAHGGRPFLLELELLVLGCWAVVLPLLYFVFSIFLFLLVSVLPLFSILSPLFPSLFDIPLRKKVYSLCQNAISPSFVKMPSPFFVCPLCFCFVPHCFSFFFLCNLLRTSLVLQISLYKNFSSVFSSSFQNNISSLSLFFSFVSLKKPSLFSPPLSQSRPLFFFLLFFVSIFRSFLPSFSLFPLKNLFFSTLAPPYPLAFIKSRRRGTPDPCHGVG